MRNAIIILIAIPILSACNPTVRVEPIKIEANITISHEIKIKVEKDVEEVLSEEDLF
ncbi:YnbE family lipoprotein [Aliikangiella sp. G2MR2-5]|uniref:YnbE family lipoprotein n=1 Tax=Aliikangiella sp. G2MR2-5 TaxID=2788943 RepID=UPI0018A95D0F|nr:YnbE family lipoprotein [Aliikangiella sp. G2MR2-5]